MLIKIVFQCPIGPKVKKFSPEDRKWFNEKCSEAIDKTSEPHHINMNLDEVKRMLKAFNDAEEIIFAIK